MPPVDRPDRCFRLCFLRDDRPGKPVGSTLSPIIIGLLRGGGAKGRGFPNIP